MAISTQYEGQVPHRKAITVILALLLLVLWGVRNAGKNSAKQAYVPPASDLFCDEGGNRKVFRHDSGEKFRDLFPMGCFALETTPKSWRGHFFATPVDPKKCPMWFYYIGLDHKTHGPMNWCSKDDPDVFSLAFWIQAAQTGEEIEFASSSIDVPDGGGGPQIAPISAISPSLFSTPELIFEPEIVTTAKAVCTTEANAAGFSGYGTVYLDVDRNGYPINIHISESTGINSLDEKVVEAAGKYRWKPAMRNGVPEPFHFRNIAIDLEHPCK